jgi:methyl-accepting chemotaxis protein
MKHKPSFLAQRNLLGVDLLLSVLVVPIYLYFLHASQSVEYLSAFGLLLLFHMFKAVALAFMIKTALNLLDRQHSKEAGLSSSELFENWQLSPKMLGLTYSILVVLTYLVCALVTVLVFPSALPLPHSSLVALALLALSLGAPSFVIAYPLLCWTLRSFNPRGAPYQVQIKREKIQTQVVTLLFALTLTPVLIFSAISHRQAMNSLYREAQGDAQKISQSFFVAYYKGSKTATLDTQCLDQLIEKPSQALPVFLTNKKGQVIMVSPALKDRSDFDFDSIRTWVKGREGREMFLTQKREGWVASIIAMDGQYQLGAVAFTKVQSKAYLSGILFGVIALGGYFLFIVTLVRLVIFEPLEQILDSWLRFLRGGEKEVFSEVPLLHDYHIQSLALMLSESAERWTTQNEITERFGRLVGIAQENWPEFVELTHERTRMVGPLVEGIHRAVEHFEKQSTDLSEEFNQHTDQWVNQREVLQDVSAVMDELRTSTQHISSSIELVLMSAERTKEAANNSVTKIAAFSDHTDRIDSILEHIQKIARQARMLSLNATIEAMRAGGEASRGFHVIASEMKTLSSGISSSVEAVQRLLQDIDQFGDMTQETANQGKELAHSTTQSAKEIATVTRQQQIVAMQLTQMIEDVSEQAITAYGKNKSLSDMSVDMTVQAQRLLSLAKEFSV